MGITLGIDVGGSATKTVGFSASGDLIGCLQVKAADQITSLYGAVGHSLRQWKMNLADVTKIFLTGVGASFITEDIYGIPTEKVSEFRAIGHGGLYLAGMKEAYVVSMGTGTAFVRASGDDMVHIGGSGVGGGTLLGLSAKILGKEDIEAILALAEDGCTENIDLLVREILNYEIPTLPSNFTAANFGNIKSTASDKDFASGIINMIFQTIGIMAAFATRNDTIKDVILTGTLTTLPQAQDIFPAIGDMYGIRFIMPEQAIYATAIGAALASGNPPLPRAFPAPHNIPPAPAREWPRSS